MKKHLKNKIIKDFHVFNPKLIKCHLLNAGKVIDKSNNQSKRESKDKIKKSSVENKSSVTPPKSEKYNKKINGSYEKANEDICKKKLCRTITK